MHLPSSPPPLLVVVVVMLVMVSTVENVHQYPKQMYAHRGMDLDSKALFTLGALAVLGGASYYLGKHDGHYKGGSPMPPYGMYGYPPPPPMAPPMMPSYPMAPPYKSVGMFKYPAMPAYNQYSYLNSPNHGVLVGSYPGPSFKKKGFAAGVYAHPIYGYQWRRRRQAGGGYDSIMTNNQRQDYLEPRVEAKASNDPEEYFNIPEDKPKDFQRSSYFSQGDSTDKNEYKESNAGRIVFKDEDDTSSHSGFLSRKKREAETTKGKYPEKPKSIRMEDDESEVVYTEQNVGTRSPKDYKPLTRQSSSARHASYLRSFPIQGLMLDPTEGHITESHGFRNPKTTFGAGQRLDPLQNQRINCEPEGREFNKFSDLMIESALADDNEGCSQSLLCVIGRTPIQNLPPKALGLRHLLQTPTGRARQYSTWRSLSEAMDAGAAGGSCARLYPSCSIPQEDLLTVFASL